MKPRVSPGYRIRTETEQVPLYSPEQSSLPESEGLSDVLLFRFSGRSSCLSGHAPFDLFVSFYLVFAQGRQEIHTAQLR